MKIFLACLVFFGLAITAMAVGVIFSNRRIKGSCGGLAGVMDENGEPTCDLCGRPSTDCLRRAERRKRAADPTTLTT